MKIDIEKFKNVMNYRTSCIKVSSAYEIATRILPPQKEIISPKLLTPRQTMAIIAPTGTGKSKLLHQIAVQQITGQKLFGKVDVFSKPQKWLIFQIENDEYRLNSEFKKLLNPLTKHQKKLVDKHLFIQEQYDHFLSGEYQFQQMKFIVDEIKPDVVCFDGLIDFSQGNLNDDSSMLHTIKCLEALARGTDPKRAVILVHHSTSNKAKTDDASGFNRKDFSRNSKTLTNKVRSQINIVPNSPNNSDILNIVCAKNSNDREFEPFSVKLNGQNGYYEYDPLIQIKPSRAKKPKKTDQIDLVKKHLDDLNVKKILVKDMVEKLKAEGMSPSSARSLIKKATLREIIKKEGKLLRLL